MPSLRGGRRKQRPRGRQRRIRSKSAPAVLRSPRREKRKQWDEDAMLAALEAVRSGCSIKQAALEHGVPRTTLYDRHIREDHCEFGCNYAPRFFFGENQQINAVRSYAYKAVYAATCLPTCMGWHCATGCSAAQPGIS